MEKQCRLVCVVMPTRIASTHVTRPAHAADVTHVPDTSTPHTRRMDAALRGATAGHAAHDANVETKHNAAHVGNEHTHKASCSLCAAHVDALHDAQRAPWTRKAERYAHVRHEAQDDAKRDATRNVDTTHDAPKRVSRKVRRTRHVVTRVAIGDTTQNGVTRARKATQRYAHDTHTHNVGDTNITSERHDVRRVRRNHSPLIVRGKGGVIDVTLTMAMLTHYRHALACLTPNER